MSKFPLLSWREVVRVLERVGFRVARQKGSQLILVKGDCTLPVPKHDEIKRGLLMAIMEEAGLTREEFLNLLK